MHTNPPACPWSAAVASQGKFRAQHVSNVTLCFRFIDNVGMRRDNIGAEDIVDGKPTPVRRTRGDNILVSGCSAPCALPRLKLYG